MKLSFQDPNHRLLVLSASFILTIWLLAIDRFLSPPAGSGIITAGLWLLLLGIAGAVLYDILPFDRRPSAQDTPDSERFCDPAGSGNPNAVKANRALLIFCLCLAYEILFVLVIPVLFGAFVPSGTIDLPAVALIVIIGVPVCFLLLLWSEIQYKKAMTLLDPDLAADVAAGFSIYASFVGPRLWLSALLLLLYAVFLGWFFFGLIGPFIIGFLPSSITPVFDPLSGGVLLALFATPALIYLIYHRRD